MKGPILSRRNRKKREFKRPFESVESRAAVLAEKFIRSIKAGRTVADALVPFPKSGYPDFWELDAAPKLLRHPVNLGPLRMRDQCTIQPPLPFSTPLARLPN